MDFSGHVDIKSLLRYRHSKVGDSVARLRALPRGSSRVALPLPGVVDAKVNSSIRSEG
ncbi:hypothetical protein D3C86_2184150 [compost metagenome]